MLLQHKVTEEFQRRYNEAPALIIRAPGRVNLIGEHTDYNDGYVLPMAIDRAAWIALRPRTDQRVLVYSMDFDASVEFRLDEVAKGRSGAPALQPNQAWAEYIRGVAWTMQDEAWTLTGWEGVVAGDVPIGAGLSSSAALELATARAFVALSGNNWDGTAMAKLAQRAENQWVGMNCGIMDQMISARGRVGHALLIDCRSLDIQPVPLPYDTAVVVLDTATRRGLVDSAYNERRSQCEFAARYFRQFQPSVTALRDVDLDLFERRAQGLDSITRKRARHIITENARTLQAVKAMEASDAKQLGELMTASHVSLRDDFEVSSDALNKIVDCAMEEVVCYGARMTGAGFGGCAVALVHEAEASKFAANVASSYYYVTGLTPNIYVCFPTNGAEIVHNPVA